MKQKKSEGREVGGSGKIGSPPQIWGIKNGESWAADRASLYRHDAPLALPMRHLRSCLGLAVRGLPALSAWPGTEAQAPSLALDLQEIWLVIVIVIVDFDILSTNFTLPIMLRMLS